MKIKFKRYSDNAIKSMRATVGSACYDLYSSMKKKYWFHLNQIKKNIYVQSAIPADCGKIVERSISALSGVWTHLGTIDSDFRGVVCVILTNIYRAEHQIKKGNCVGQIIF